METEALLDLIKKPGMYSDFYIRNVYSNLGAANKKQALYKRTFAAVEVDWDCIAYLTDEQVSALENAGVERWK